MLIILACAVGTYVLHTCSQNNKPDTSRFNTTNTTIGGDDTEQMMDTDTETETGLSGIETEDVNYASVDQDNDEDQQLLLELEKKKQELELENQKIKLQQLEAQNTYVSNPVKEPEQKQNNVNEEQKLMGLDSCNPEHNVNNNNFNLLDNQDCNSDYYTISDDYYKPTNEKIKPNELLPSASDGTVDMKHQNFLSATVANNMIGKPTQTHRSRLNYDLRSTPPNPQIEVSPWNMSTMEPDSDRRHFEIGTPSNEPSV